MLTALRLIRLGTSTSAHRVGVPWPDCGLCFLMIYPRAEHNAIHRYNATTGIVEPFIRNPVIQVSIASNADDQCC